VNIRPKVILSIAAVFALLGAAQFVVERQIILPSFAELERADARTAMRRIQSAFDLTLDRIALSAMDWGNWADVYRAASEGPGRGASLHLLLPLATRETVPLAGAA